MVEKDRFNVGVACDDVIVNGRRVKHRRLARQRGQDSERIGEERRRERIEVGMHWACAVFVGCHRFFPPAPSPGRLIIGRLTAWRLAAPH
jgi:hypothetical protein